MFEQRIFSIRTFLLKDTIQWTKELWVLLTVLTTFERFSFYYKDRQIKMNLNYTFLHLLQIVWDILNLVFFCCKHVAYWKLDLGSLQIIWNSTTNDNPSHSFCLSLKFPVSPAVVKKSFQKTFRYMSCVTV